MNTSRARAARVAPALPAESPRAPEIVLVRAQPEQSEADGIIEGQRALIEPGTYLARFDTWITRAPFGPQYPKVALLFALENPLGVSVERFYHVRRLIGKPRKRGRFVVGPHSDLLRDYVTLTQRRTRIDRLALSALEGRTYRIVVRTVERDAKQRELPPALCYSTISEIFPE